MTWSSTTEGEDAVTREYLANSRPHREPTHCGTLPFPAADRITWRQSVLAGSYTPLKEHLEDPPAPWREFFDRSLAVDRERRPRSASEFLQQLEQALACGAYSHDGAA